MIRWRQRSPVISKADGQPKELRRLLETNARFSGDPFFRMSLYPRRATRSQRILYRMPLVRLPVRLYNYPPFKSSVFGFGRLKSANSIAHGIPAGAAAPKASRLR